MSKTGEIQDFVITEESGIAKGIRRIIAVTGQEASEAKRTAHLLTTKLEQIEKSERKAKDVALKAFNIVRYATTSSEVEVEMITEFVTGTQSVGHFSHPKVRFS